MKRHLSRIARDSGAKIEFTAMIDVVFLLLIFFVVTMRPLDTFSRLESAVDPGRGSETPIEIMRIDVREDSYVVNGRTLDLDEADRVLGAIASHSNRPGIAIRCAPAARHERLVGLLDACAKHKLANLTLLSR